MRAGLVCGKRTSHGFQAYMSRSELNACQIKERDEVLRYEGIPLSNNITRSAFWSVWRISVSSIYQKRHQGLEDTAMPSISSQPGEGLTSPHAPTSKSRPYRPPQHCFQRLVVHLLFLASPTQKRPPHAEFIRLKLIPALRIAT